MAYALSPYRSFVPRTVKGPVIIVLIILQSFVLGITSATASRLAAFYGIAPETVTWFSQAGAIGMVAIIPVYYRLRMYFQKSDLLQLALGLQVVLSLLCFTVNDAPLLLTGNFFIGMLKLACLLDFISLLTNEYPVMRHRALFYGIYYTIARFGGELANILVNPVLEADDWRDIYLISAAAAAICMVLCVCLFHRQRMQRRVPLYQVDWLSMLLFVAAAFLFAYILTYGKTLDWFEEDTMVYALVGCMISTALFIYRQFQVRRPFWNLRVFRLYRQVPLGIAFMLVLYVFYSTNLLFNYYAGYNFRGEENYLSQVAVVTLCAYLVSFPLTGWLLYKGAQRRVMLSLGFLLYGGSLYLFCNNIQTAASLDALVVPFLLQGMAYGLVLTTLSTFAATNVPRHMNGDRVMGSLSFRYIIGSFAGYSLYSNWLFRGTAAHAASLSERLTAGNPLYSRELGSFTALYQSRGMDLQHATLAAQAVIQKKLQLQAMLVSLRDIAMYVAVIAVIAAVLVLLVRRFEMHEIAAKNKYKIV
ncbi:MFS transporter [Chitinophaga oryzae]|uniref:MFS transporter n=1 Tax=Chitinophaga oryzae TaxID=2725414 RepID=A0AAE7DAM7_9BACT|nr:MFS transporter [Chitinophaga oryzae]QJB35583.1 MFS transporter [Chitinophaga oryzae]QJB42125.1 MFS transporter [Chitinophaga oryzae]